MSRKVSILDGEVNRNWNLVDKRGRRHILTLLHDTVSGARAAMLDYEEIPGSVGTTNVFNLGSAHRLPFWIKESKESGELRVLRRGLAGFSYQCELGGKLVPETTSLVQNPKHEFHVSIERSVNVPLKAGINSGEGQAKEQVVTWYEMRVKRRVDGASTVVHHRFRDFAALHEQVDAMMKGHHLRSSLPKFPNKHLKLMVDHRDEAFVADRRDALQQYMHTLLQVPHVGALDSTNAFLGMVGSLREVSVAWTQKTLGVTLEASVPPGTSSVGCRSNLGVTSIQDTQLHEMGLVVGDKLSKVNGESTHSKSSFEVLRVLRGLPRPVILHFIGEAKGGLYAEGIKAANSEPIIPPWQIESVREERGHLPRSTGPGAYIQSQPPQGRAQGSIRWRSPDAWQNAQGGCVSKGKESYAWGYHFSPPVGPFGNGTGATQQLSATSGLFGGDGKNTMKNKEWDRMESLSTGWVEDRGENLGGNTFRGREWEVGQRLCETDCARTFPVQESIVSSHVGWETESWDLGTSGGDKESTGEGTCEITTGRLVSPGAVLEGGREQGLVPFVSEKNGQLPPLQESACQPISRDGVGDDSMEENPFV
ncbi:unnamed protein product [Choristocarpus tenellus]